MGNGATKCKSCKKGYSVLPSKNGCVKGEAGKVGSTCISDKDCPTKGQHCSSEKKCVKYNSEHCDKVKCGLGDGDCDTSGDKHGCAAGLYCGSNNCKKWHPDLEAAGMAKSTDCCEANKCKCENGTPATGKACKKNKATLCKKCKKGYILNKGKTACLEKGSAGAPCESD